MLMQQLINGRITKVQLILIFCQTAFYLQLYINMEPEKSGILSSYELPNGTVDFKDLGIVRKLIKCSSCALAILEFPKPLYVRNLKVIFSF